MKLNYKKKEMAERNYRVKRDYDSFSIVTESSPYLFAEQRGSFQKQRVVVYLNENEIDDSTNPTMAVAKRIAYDSNFVVALVTNEDPKYAAYGDVVFIRPKNSKTFLDGLKEYDNGKRLFYNGEVSKIRSRKELSDFLTQFFRDNDKK